MAVHRSLAKVFAIAGLVLLALTSCQPAAGLFVTSTPVSAAFPEATEIPPTAAASATPRPTATRLSPTGTPIANAPVCSPLEGLTFNELGQPDILKNPIETPHPGLDDGHHGIDFAYYSRGDRTTMHGLPIYSVLPGTVAAAVTNRPPYGNMILVETPLELLSQAQQKLLSLPAVVPTIQPGPAMVCPTPAIPFPSSTKRSLYFLYAHMENPPVLKVGDPVACGLQLGGVGTTGMSVNDHLHLEARIGPSGVRFEGMAFYDTGAADIEMENYCRWRVSQTFQLLDPLDTLLTLKNQ